MSDSERAPSRREFLEGVLTVAGGIGAGYVISSLEERTPVIVKPKTAGAASETGKVNEIIEIVPAGAGEVIEIVGPDIELQIVADTQGFEQMADKTAFVVGQYGDPKFLPENFHPQINAGGIIPEQLVRIAYILYKNKVPGLNQEMALFSLATLTTESSSNGLYISTGYATTMGNFNCANPTVSKQGQTNALKKIADWLGGFKTLAGPAQETLNAWPNQRGWQITDYSNFPASSCGAAGPKQFLPKTWVAEVNYRKNLWNEEQRQALISRLKELGLIREKVGDIQQLHPMIPAEAMIMGILYMQHCGISVSGNNFYGWNQSSSQRSLAVARYGIIKAELDKY